ncbi:hypothetical protein FOZ62_018295 [Perkinsus olseni]|uniref:TRUD domain-containing protein n=3 Tax=Perkinsus olseni TaxID=32597 RepID=A0A7J6TJ61_PEROL|nr:hypothetical protein FOZ62_018295 [Perkinsus olseni]
MNGLDPPPQSISLECKQRFADIDIVGYVKNRGSRRWPETAALQFCHGRYDGGCPRLHLAGLQPGEVAQVVLDLRNLTVSGEGADHMVWCIINSDTGEVLDPTQLIEVAIGFTASNAGDLPDVEGDVSDASSPHSSFIFPSESGGSDSSWMDCGNIPTAGKQKAARTNPKAPSPESVGVTEFIGNERIGGALKTHVRDFQVREVGIDGKVARMSGEFLLKSWAVVERAMTKQNMHELHDFDEEAASESPSGTWDSGQDLASSFRQGYDMSLRETEVFIRGRCGPDAVDKIERFVKSQRAVRGGYALIISLPKGSLDHGDLFQLKGAMLKKALSCKVPVFIATKFTRENVEVGLVINAKLNAHLRSYMSEDDGQQLIRFFVAGYSSETLTLTLRTRGHYSDEDILDRFVEGTKSTLRDLEFDVSNGGEAKSLLVQARWTREHTQLSLSRTPRWRFVLEKQNVELQTFLLGLERQLRLPRDSVHYAGLKDKRGITHQFISAPATHSEAQIRAAVEQLNEDLAGTGSVRVDNFQVDNTGRKLRSGMLMGNWFGLRIRGVCEGASQKLKSLQTVGFINYFGMQRFGFEVDGASVPVLIGGALLAGDIKMALQLWARPSDSNTAFARDMYEEWMRDGRATKALQRLKTLPRPIQEKLKLWKELLEYVGDDADEPKYREAVKHLNLPKAMLHLFPTAYSACLWNRLASRRIRDGGLCVRAGDLVAVGAGDNFEKLKRVESDEEACQYTINDIRLPQLGLQREGICRVSDAGVDVQKL